MKKNRLVNLLQTTWQMGMKQAFIAILCVCATFAQPVKAQLLDQPVSLSIENEELKFILQQIQKQVELKFVYSPTAIQINHRMSVHASNKKLSEILAQILIPLKIQYKIKNDRILLFKLSELANAMNQTAGAGNEEPVDLETEKKAPVPITGKVSGKNKEGIPGASVVIKGTTIGVTTDSDGRYSLIVPDENQNGTLIFSFIGFKTAEVPIGRQTTIDVQLLEDIAALSEVVINGYQQIRKESFTGTAVTVTGAELKAVNPLNLLQSVQAFDPSFRVAQNNIFGSDPNKLPNITVRGATGLPTNGTTTDKNTLSRGNLANNSSQPTFILNGFEVSLQTIYDLDINKVESITLLKDAAASAVYGSRAANGVLVIKTKKLTEGKIQLSYNYDLSVTGPDLTVYKVLNAKDKLEYERLAGLYKYDNSTNQDDLDQMYYQKKRSVISGINTYWLSEPVETALGHNHSLSVQGGNSALQYGVTARYQNLKGVMKGSDRTRYGGDVNLAYNLNDKLLFNNILSITEVQSQESPYGDFSEYVRMNPYYAKTDSNGNSTQEIDYWQQRTTSSAEGNSAIVTDHVLNPAYNARLSSFNKSAYTQVINALSASWRVAQGLELRGLVSITKQRSTYDRFKSPFSNEYYGKTGDDLKKRGEYRFEATDETTLDGNVVLSYNKGIGQHFVNTSLGTNFRDYTSDFKGFTAIGFANDRFDNIGFANRYQEDAAPSGSLSTERLLGTFFNANYSFADRFVFDLGIRMDGSSKFGTDNKYAPFWTAGAGWNLHKEAFLRSSKVINQLKIRATTGLTGEVSFPSYLAKTTYQYESEWYSSGVGAVYKAYGNEALKWQRTRNYDLGMEMQLFQNRIFFSARYYKKLTKDVLADIIVPPSLGFSSYKANLGEMENRGVEVNLRLDVIRKQAWYFNVYANMVRNVNQINKISESLKKYNDEIDKQQDTEENKGTPLLRYKEGESLNTIYGVPSLGIDPENGKEIYIKKNGSHTYEYSVKDIVPVGNSSPEAEGYFGGTLSYKSVSLNASFYTKFGGDLYNQTLVDRIENANPRYNVDQRVLDDRWKKPGDQVVFKDIANKIDTRPSSRFIQKDNVFELRSVNLTYESPKSWTRTLKMQSLRFVLTMNDIWRWSAVKMERGIDYPFARTVTFSIQTRF